MREGVVGTSGDAATAGPPVYEANDGGSTGDISMRSAFCNAFEEVSAAEGGFGGSSWSSSPSNGTLSKENGFSVGGGVGGGGSGPAASWALSLNDGAAAAPAAVLPFGSTAGITSSTPTDAGPMRTDAPLNWNILPARVDEEEDEKAEAEEEGADAPVADAGGWRDGPLPDLEELFLLSGRFSRRFAFALSDCGDSEPALLAAG